MEPTFAEVDLGVIARNLQAIQRHVAPARMMAVVKADAYGHGAVPVSRVALESGCTHLGVARLEEGLELREHGIRAPILVFGGLLPEQADDFIRHDLAGTLCRGAVLVALQRAARRHGKQAVIHVKVDTGMGRAGIPWERAAGFIAAAASSEAVRLEGAYTHFASSDEADKAFTYQQLDRFRNVLTACAKAGISIPFRHASNSGAILDVPAAWLDLVRPGVTMYGYYPSSETSESVAVRPAMTFKTRVLQIKELTPGDTVSYGRTFIASRKTRVALLPVGYADGYQRGLSNRGRVLIRGREFAVIGRVCMDLTLVDVSEDPDVRPGDEVVLFGHQQGRNLSVESLCDLLDAIPYQVTCWVSRRVPRVHVGQP